MSLPSTQTNFCPSQRCKKREKLLRKVFRKLDLITSWLTEKYGNKEAFPPHLKTILNDSNDHEWIEIDAPNPVPDTDFGIPKLVPVDETQTDDHPVSFDRDQCEVKIEPCTDQFCSSPTCPIHSVDLDSILDATEPESCEPVDDIGEDSQVPLVKPCSIILVRLSNDDIEHLKQSDDDIEGLKESDDDYDTEDLEESDDDYDTEDLKESDDDIDIFDLKVKGSKRQKKTKTKRESPKIDHKCDLCSKTFRTENQLRIHRMIHTGETQYTCEECGRKFRQLEPYKTHLRRHKGEKPHKCPFTPCTKAFACSTELRKHTYIHTGERKYKCDICPKTFKLGGALKSHKAAVHAAKALYTCDICDKGFQGKNAMLCHRRSHTEEAPFECEVPGCDRKFKCKQSLQNHRLRIHSETTIRHYECTTCGKKLFDKWRFKQHQTMHAKVLDFTCEHCGKGFNQQRYLDNHSKVIHNPSRVAGNTYKPFQCEICPSNYTYKKDLEFHKKKKHGDDSVPVNFTNPKSSKTSKTSH